MDTALTLNKQPSSNHLEPGKPALNNQQPANDQLARQQQQLQQDFQRLKHAFDQAPYPTLHMRRHQLQTLKRALLDKEQALYRALNRDYGYRSEFDSFIADVMPSMQQLNYTLKKLSKWLKPSRRHAGLAAFPSSVKVHYQPVGVVGVIVPWNFPIFLSLGPIITALAAGNRVMVKLSEFTPHTNQVIAQLFAELSDQMVIVEGESELAAFFSRLPFDHLFFTGSTAVGRLVAQSAAENLTPITLELGGKSPVIIAPDARLNSAIDSILLGKSINAGQTCVAPDYILLPKSMQADFIAAFKQRFQQLFISDNNCNCYSQVLNPAQYQRLQSYLVEAKAQGAGIYPVVENNTGENSTDKNTDTASSIIDNTDTTSDGQLMYPHLVTDIQDNISLMQSEIFGPILPIVTYDNIDEAFDYIRQQPRPLALYLMSQNKTLTKQVIEASHSGGVCINDTLMQVAADDAPFGGIGESGLGHYHGIEGFKTFSHAKTVFSSSPYLPRSGLLLKHRDLTVKIFRKLFFR